MADSAFIAVTRQGIGGVESQVWVNVDTIAFVEAQEDDQRTGGSTLHLRAVEDVATMHVKERMADLVNQLPTLESTSRESGSRAPAQPPRRGRSSNSAAS